MHFIRVRFNNLNRLKLTYKTINYPITEFEISIIKITLFNVHLNNRKALYAPRVFYTVCVYYGLCIRVYVIGLRRDNAISPVLLDIALETESLEREVEGMDENSFRILSYANDIVVLNEYGDDLKIRVHKRIDPAKKIGLKITENKTEFMGE